MSFWAEIGVSKAKEQVVGDDEADLTITRCSLSNAAKLKDGSRVKLLALGEGYDDWIAVCSFIVGTEESCGVRLHVAANSVLRFKVQGDGIVDITGFAAIPYDMEDVSDDEGSIDSELKAKLLAGDKDEDEKLRAMLGSSDEAEGDDDEEMESGEGEEEEEEEEGEEEDEEDEEDDDDDEDEDDDDDEEPAPQKRKTPAAAEPAGKKQKLAAEAAKKAPPAKDAAADRIKKAAASGAQFIQSSTFVASISGYVFKKDRSGLGYYKDVKPVAAKKAPKPGTPAAADAWADKKLQQMKWKNGPQGLKFRDLVVGTGATPRKGQQVTVHYTGKLQKNGKQFDSSVGRAPFRFGYGRGEVIRGWDLGLEGMKCGGRRTLEIPAALGYGRQGAGRDIPPNSNLTFEVQLLKCG